MNKKIMCIGHRGSSGNFPENTLESFQKALDVGADMFELDVQCCRSEDLSEKLVIIHDDTVDRTTNGTGLVSDMSLEDLKKLDAGKGQKIPTLKEMFE